jgi:methyl-accepting chemotaxis protein
MSLTKKILLMMSLGGFGAAIVFSVYMFFSSRYKALSDSQKAGEIMLGQNVELINSYSDLFMGEWEQSFDKKQVLNKWNPIFKNLIKTISKDNPNGPQIKLHSNSNLDDLSALGAEVKSIPEVHTKTVKADYETMTITFPMKTKSQKGCKTCHYANKKGVDWTIDNIAQTQDVSLGSIQIALDQGHIGKEVLTQTLQFLVFVLVALSAVISIVFILLKRFVIYPLTRLSGDLNQSSQEVQNVSVKLEVTSEDMLNSSVEQSDATQLTASSMDEISAMIQKNAESAEKSRELALNSQEVTKQGKDKIAEMISTINDISQSNTQMTEEMQNNNKEMTEVVEVIQHIGEKTKVINDIVFQTKLLSFNASVEAARAGEHGKGFSVVAEEVGNLAEMSGKSAKDITDILEGSIDKVQRLVESTKKKMEDLITSSRDKVERGITVANECGSSLDEIFENVEIVNNMVDEIASASSEQSIGVSEVTKAVGKLDQLTQKNSTLSRTTSDAAKQLNMDCKDLDNIVLGLTDLIGNDVQAISDSLSEEDQEVDDILGDVDEAQTSEKADPLD